MGFIWNPHRRANGWEEEEKAPRSGGGLGEGAQAGPGRGGGPKCRVRTKLTKEGAGGEEEVDQPCGGKIWADSAGLI